MDIRIKSYFTLSEALTDQAALDAYDIISELQNTQDVHPSLVGQIFLTVNKHDAVEAIKLLNEDLFSD